MIPQDVHGLLGMEHLGKLVNSLRSRADLVVIRSPAVSESAESYMVCAVADRTLLVAGAGSSADSVVAARDQMERVGVSLLGVAFVERPKRRRAESGSNDGPAHVTAKASSAGSRSTAHGSLSGSVHRVASASALAQLVGQLVSFVQTIVLARLLTPTDIGIFAAGTVLTALLTNFVEGGLQAGLVQRQGDLADADETVFRVTLMVGAAASLGCLAAAPVIGIIFNSRTAGLVAAATAGVVLIHSLTNVPEAVLQREFSVKRRLIVGPAIAVSYAVVAVGLAALGWGVWSMVAGMYASYIAWVVSLWMITSWRPGRGHASFAMWRELARYGFPLVLAMIGFRLRTAVEALVVGRVLSTAALGFFRYGQRIALIPEMGIIQVGAITLFPAFCRIAGDRKRFAAAYLRALHWSMVGAAAGTGLMIAVGEPAVVVLFGERWRGAGVALVAMSGVSIGAAIAVVAQDVIKAHGRTRLINWFTLADLFLGVGFLLVLTRAFGFVGASLYISVTVLMDAAILLGLAQQLVIVPLRRVLTVLATPIPGLLIATMATWWLEHDILRADSRGPILAVTLLAVDALVFCLIYLAVLTLFARSTVVTIVRSVPVLIARFRQRALPTPHRDIRNGRRPTASGDRLQGRAAQGRRDGPYRPAAAAGRSQVAAVGCAQEFQLVWTARKRDTDPGHPTARSSPLPRSSAGCRWSTCTPLMSRWGRGSSRSAATSGIRSRCLVNGHEWGQAAGGQVADLLGRVFLVPGCITTDPPYV